MLVVLEVVVGAEVGRQVRIPRDQTCKIGRTNFSDEAFSDDVMMSGQHFEIRNDGKYCWLRDLDSRNGTRVDDDFVKEGLVIRDGQKIYAGRTEFLVKIDGGAKNPYESTNVGNFEPVKNSSLMSMTFGSQANIEQDPRFPQSEVPGSQPPGAPLPPGAPAGPPVPPGAPMPPVGGNLEIPPGGESPGFPPPNFDPPTADAVPGQPPGMPPHSAGKNPPWGQSAPPAITPGQSQPLPPGAPHDSPGNFPPGMPPKRGGSDGPVFRFAKGGVDQGPIGPPPGLPGDIKPTPGKFPPANPARPDSPPFDRAAPGNAPPNIDPPEPPNFENPESFPPTPDHPLPPGTPPGNYVNFDEPNDPPSFTNFPPEEPGKSVPPGSQNVPPWENKGGFGQGANPNLDFGSDDFGPSIGPALDFEEDPEDDPKLGPPSFSPPSGPSFTNQQGPVGGNPNLIGFSDEEEPAAKFSPPPTFEKPDESLGDSPNFVEPKRPESPADWRNPDYVSSTPPASNPEEQPAAEKPTPITSIRGLCFQEEIAKSNYPVYHSIIEGVPQVPFSPFALIRELSKLAKPVLSIHFLRAEKSIPEDLAGVPLRGDLDEKFAALGGPMLYCPEDLEPFREIIEELWGMDAISCLFTHGDPKAVVEHFREGLFAPTRGDLPAPGPGPQFFAIFSPNLLTTFLSQRDQEIVDELLGDSVQGVLTEVADMPDSWQLFTKKPWTESLKKLGMNRVVEQSQ